MKKTCKRMLICAILVKKQISCMLLCLKFRRENYCTCCAEAFLVAANAGRSSTTQLCGEWGWWLVRITSEAESLQRQSDIKVEVVYTVIKGSLEETILVREIQNHHNRSITADYSEKSSGWRWYLAVDKYFVVVYE